MVRNGLDWNSCKKAKLFDFARQVQLFIQNIFTLRDLKSLSYSSWITWWTFLTFWTFFEDFTGEYSGRWFGGFWRIFRNILDALLVGTLIHFQSYFNPASLEYLWYLSFSFYFLFIVLVNEVTKVQTIT